MSHLSERTKGEKADLNMRLISFRGDIAPGQKVSVMLSFSPRRVGVRKLMVDFDSDRLKDVKGVATVVVRKRHFISGVY